MRNERQYCVYIITNRYNTILYTGVTNDLHRRIIEHKEKAFEGFTAKYNVYKLVFYEVTSNVHAAITREKQIKGWLRRRKRKLVTGFNPKWKDLSKELFN